MIDTLKRLWNERPLAAIILIALVPRLVAAVFSKGYGMHDDHFGPIEQPFIIMQYLTYWTGRVVPHGHSIVYPSTQYALLNLFQSAGISDPQTNMLLTRLLHALYSLLVVVFGFKIAEFLSGREAARKAGLVLALFWVLPFLSVRNLIEVVCVPPLMGGFYYALKSRDNLRSAFIAGLWFGLAFAFRYQTLLISGTVGVIFLFRKEFREMLWFAAGFILFATLVQGTADILAWGYPFASFVEYVRYNMAHGEDYTTGPWYNYILLVIGAFIPPMSFFLIYGFFKKWRKAALIVIPVIIFFALHSYFPNKQERFILPVIPAILLLGIVGWEEHIKGSEFWSRHRSAVKNMWISFWAINLVLLLLFSTYYAKKSRVEVMYALYGKPVTGIIMMGGKVGTAQPPFFYLGKYPISCYEVDDDARLPDVKAETIKNNIVISHAVFFGVDDLDRRVRYVESEMRLKLSLEKRVDPSFLDVVFYRLNPTHNKNEVGFIYRADSQN